MTRLPPETYLAHLRTESARFRDVLAACDPAARVPSCPDWSAADLLWHLATVQRWWAEVLTARPAKPEDVQPPRPEAYDDLLARYDAWSADLAVVLETAEPADEAWNWSERRLDTTVEPGDGRSGAALHCRVRRAGRPRCARRRGRQLRRGPRLPHPP